MTVNNAKILNRVSVLPVNKDQFVLIFRHKHGEDYYAIPGGGVESNETPQQAAEREILEELGFSLTDIKFISEVKTDSRIDFNFIAQTSDIDFIVSGPEKKHLNDPDDLFEPQWLNLKTIRRDIPIYPENSRCILDYLSIK